MYTAMRYKLTPFSLLAGWFGYSCSVLIYFVYLFFFVFFLGILTDPHTVKDFELVILICVLASCQSRSIVCVGC